MQQHYAHWSVKWHGEPSSSVGWACAKINKIFMNYFEIAVFQRTCIRWSREKCSFWKKSPEKWSKIKLSWPAPKGWGWGASCFCDLSRCKLSCAFHVLFWFKFCLEVLQQVTQKKYRSLHRNLKQLFAIRTLKAGKK